MASRNRSRRHCYAKCRREKLQKEGISRHDLGKEKFLEKIWEWKEEYGNKILDQLKKSGLHAIGRAFVLLWMMDIKKPLKKRF